MGRPCCWEAEAKLANGLPVAKPHPATRKRAEENGPPDQMTGVAFLQNSDDDVFKAVGPLEDIEPVVFEEDREAEFDEDEVRWWDLE